MPRNSESLLKMVRRFENRTDKKETTSFYLKMAVIITATIIGFSVAYKSTTNSYKPTQTTTYTTTQETKPSELENKIKKTYNQNIIFRDIKIEKGYSIWKLNESYLKSAMGADFNTIKDDREDILTYEITLLTLKMNNLNWDKARNLKVGEHIKLPEVYYSQNNEELIILTKEENKIKTYRIKTKP